MSWFPRFLPGVSVLLGAAVITAARPAPASSAPVAGFHLRLVKSDPAADDTVSSPRAIRLWFSMLPQVSVTSAKLTGPTGGAVALGRPTFIGDLETPVEMTIGQPLAPGRYTVAWKTASRDMHPVSGDFSFVVK